MEEIEEIIISMLAIVAAFSIASWGFEVFVQKDFILRAVILMFTVGVGFISHELGHKYAAERFGSSSRFVMWPQGIVFMLLLAPLGVIFAAPGAVYIFKRMGRKENGIVSLAGPAINMLLFLFFAAVLVAADSFGVALSAVVAAICSIGMQINALLAVFNLIPLFILDGAKIMNWDWKVWLAAFVVGLMMMFGAGSFVSI